MGLSKQTPARIRLPCHLRDEKTHFQELLIKLLDLKFGLEEGEQHRIFVFDDIRKLNSALEAIVLEEKKESILEILSKITGIFSDL